jgi:hypothetical protein
MDRQRAIEALEQIPDLLESVERLIIRAKLALEESNRTHPVCECDSDKVVSMADYEFIE